MKKTIILFTILFTILISGVYSTAPDMPSRGLVGTWLFSPHAFPGNKGDLEETSIVVMTQEGQDWGYVSQYSYETGERVDYFKWERWNTANNFMWTTLVREKVYVGWDIFPTNTKGVLYMSSSKDASFGFNIKRLDKSTDPYEVGEFGLPYER